MGRHLAMLREDLIDSCLPCTNITTQNPYTYWRHKGNSTPTPYRLRQPTQSPKPHWPRTAGVPPRGNEAANASDIDGVPSAYVYIYTALPSAQ